VPIFRVICERWDSTNLNPRVFRFPQQATGKGHDFTGCGKTHRCGQNRGRAALQGRVSRLWWASALVVPFSPSMVSELIRARRDEFFRNLFSRAKNQPRFSARGSLSAAEMGGSAPVQPRSSPFSPLPRRSKNPMPCPRKRAPPMPTANTPFLRFLTLCMLSRIFLLVSQATRHSNWVEQLVPLAQSLCPS
jgi:hypothetical protein